MRVGYNVTTPSFARGRRTRLNKNWYIDESLKGAGTKITFPIPGNEEHWTHIVEGSRYSIFYTALRLDSEEFEEVWIDG